MVKIWSNEIITWSFAQVPHFDGRSGAQQCKLHFRIVKITMINNHSTCLYISYSLLWFEKPFPKNIKLFHTFSRKSESQEKDAGPSSVTCVTLTVTWGTTVPIAHCTKMERTNVQLVLMFHKCPIKTDFWQIPLKHTQYPRQAVQSFWQQRKTASDALISPTALNRSWLCNFWPKSVCQLSN